MSRVGMLRDKTANGDIKTYPNDFTARMPLLSHDNVVLNVCNIPLLVSNMNSEYAFRWEAWWFWLLL